jgi:membrane-bound lytic murein transglycosylase F
MNIRRGGHIKSFRWLTAFIAVAVIVFGIVLVYIYFDGIEDNNDKKRDFVQIKKEGVLTVVISTNPIDYFIYQGQPMGFQLEMLEAFVSEHKLELNIIVENDPQKGIDMLLNQECDILAQSFINSSERDLLVDFTIPVRQTHQVLVQRVGGEQNVNHDSVVLSLADLRLKTIYVQKDGSNLQSLKNLASELIHNFYIVEVDSIPPEAIIKFVSEGVYDFAVVDFAIAKISKNYWPNLDIETSMSFPQNISWCVRPESVELLDTLNVWLEKYIVSDDYSRLNRKYINNSRTLVNIESEFYSGNEGKISEYDQIIKKYSPELGWDWRLVASLIYEESRFNSSAESWAGAYGLMQLMPTTYKKFAPTNVSGTEAEICAGIRYLKYLDSQFVEHVKDSSDRIMFVLAAYNIGPGHVEDAMRLANSYKKDASSWKEVSFYISNLSNPKYYNDTAVKYGYFPGIYSVDFTNSIVNRYKHYLNVIPH